MKKKVSKTQKKSRDKKINWRVIIYSFIGIASVICGFVFNDWIFLLPAVICMLLNQRELSRKN